VDRQAIQMIPEPDAPAARQSFVAHGSVLERQVLQIWINVLGLSQIGMDDNFFDAGGNSIQLAQVHTRLQALVKREFPITDMLVHTTIRAAVAFLAKDTKLQAGGNSIQDRARRQREALSTRRNVRRP
jgi:acyl carrier protein